MPTGLKSLRYDGVHTRLLAFGRELGATDHMGHLDARGLQTGCPGLGITRGSKDNLHALFLDNLHEGLDLWIHQGDVHAKRFRGSCLAFTDMLTQHLGVHGACAQ